MATTIPKAVAKQADKSKELVAELARKRGQAPSQQPPDPVTAPAEPAVPTPAPEPSTPPEPALEPVLETPTPPPAAVTEGDPPGKPPEAKDHKYDVLKGKFDKILPTLQAKVKELEAKIEDDSQTIATLNNLVLQSRAADIDPTPTAPVNSGISQEMRDMVGEDNIIAFQQIAAEEARKAADAAVQPLRAETDRERFARVKAELTTRVPEWELLDFDPDFTQWAESRDPGSGMQRQALMRDAFVNGDVNRLVYFYESYDAEKPPPTPTTGDFASDLDDLATPPVSQHSPVPQSSGPVTVYLDEMTGHTHSLIHKKGYKGSPEADRMEERIREATRNQNLRQRAS